MSDDKAEISEICAFLTEHVLNFPDGFLDRRVEDTLLRYEAKESDVFVLHVTRDVWKNSGLFIAASWVTQSWAVDQNYIFIPTAQIRFNFWSTGSRAIPSRNI